ncbi:MAG: glutamine synthetase family protein [Pseudomonadota bacterium]|nr:glutamine synthetase family protein [Pseudomonadota bacterium]
MTGILDREELERLIFEGNIDTVLVCFPDMQGRLVGKRVTGRFYIEEVQREMHVCDYLLAVDMEMEPVPGFKAASWDRGYGDFAVRPDPKTLRRIPWLEGTALVIGDCVDHCGDDLPHAPRSILKRQLARANAAGFTVKMGSELEFYLFDETYEEVVAKRYENLKTAGEYIEDYHIFQTTKEEDLIRAVRNGMEGAGVPVEFSKGEWGPGQEEINLRYAEALQMADRHSIYKNGLKEMAWQRGKSVTFMAKWREDLAGNSCHIHSSLWRLEDGTPAFPGTNDANDWSETFQNYLAGQVALARDMTLFLAPYINSYKRFQSGSFAPTKTVWSRDNRTAGFRVIGSSAGLRVENRLPGADVNPYLAFAATVAAGLYGIEKGLSPMGEAMGNIYEQADAVDVPLTLREAIIALELSEPMRMAFGEDVVEHYLHAARWEQSEYDRRITDFELKRNFERS